MGYGRKASEIWADGDKSFLGLTHPAREGYKVAVTGRSPDAPFK
jgi:hypothetical protein